MKNEMFCETAFFNKSDKRKNICRDHFFVDMKNHKITRAKESEENLIQPSSDLKIYEGR